MIRNFLDRGTAALLTVLPDRHDVIECISTASQFYILEAIKVVLNKPIDHFHLRLLLTLLPWLPCCCEKPICLLAAIKRHRFTLNQRRKLELCDYKT